MIAFLITNLGYDISDPKLWRKVFRTLEGYGEWIQLSVFQCRLSALRHQRLVHELESVIQRCEDHVLVFNLGPADGRDLDVVSLGKTFQAVAREPIII